jgi:Leucine-rich repeat (LRR) protein
MTSLSELNLSYNAFSGTIPSELGRLTNLEWLGLQNLTLLTGSIPSELFLFTSLRYLDLRNMYGLSGIIPDELCFSKNG